MTASAQPEVSASHSPTVSAVIPTVGRASLVAAIHSALKQVSPVLEVLVCADTNDDLAHLIPSDSRVRVIRVGPQAGGNAARQAGILAARGALVALLDDDDAWEPTKLQVQLRQVSASLQRDRIWLAASRIRVVGPQAVEIWPDRLIVDQEPIARYILWKHRPRAGVGFLQTSTLLFARDLGIQVPWRAEQRYHQDLDWLLRVGRRFPDIQVIQAPHALTTYTATSADTLSRRITPGQSRDWAIATIRGDPRGLGDFLLTGPTIAAARVGDPRTVASMIRVGILRGSPGVAALVFASYQFLIALKIRVTASARGKRYRRPAASSGGQASRRAEPHNSITPSPDA